MAPRKGLHMNAGDGEASYANNSSPQKAVISKTWPVLDETLKHMFADNGFPKCLKMVDLGCPSGPNTLLVISHVVDTIEGLQKLNDVNNLPEEVEVFLNDLPDNDLKNLFNLLPNFCQKINEKERKLKCYVYGVSDSFHGRLFPSKSLHFAYSSYSLQWLSRVP